jgi:5'-3' exonuclease
MGIPSYFTKVVKSYRHILKEMTYLSHINNLYMDCNSLIYDAVKNNPTYEKGKNKEYETELIHMVCRKIDFYVESLQPKNRVFIAFDGVAPVAKLSQQRDRRYKSWYTTEIQRDIEGKNYKEKWNTSSITPGTNFMRELNDAVVTYYKNKTSDKMSDKTSNVNGAIQYIVSTSFESGEGEHKIFEYMRKYPEYHNSPDIVTLVYGLDADLIMLTLNHLHISKNLYLFRETPEFIKSVDSTLDANKDYLLDIPELANSIVKYITNSDENKLSYDVVDNKLKHDENRIKDYIFMCFLLGNDFMPHFPALNIRTVGIDILLHVYRETLGNADKYLTDGRKIVWKNFGDFIKNIAEQEDTLLMDEHKKRDKFSKRLGDHTNVRGNRCERNAFNPQINNNQKESGSKILDDSDDVLGADITSVDDLLMLPMKERSVEKYINPFMNDWEYRYYKALFDIDITDERKKQICVNYLEGLEWTFHYYIEGCIDWRWCYNYHYAPLFKDLVKYIPHMDTQFLKPKDKEIIEDLVQLCYVLPRENLNLLPLEVNIVLLQRLGHLYGSDYDFKWAYCRYFWESHADLPRLYIETLEEVVEKAKSRKSFAISRPIDIPKSPIMQKKTPPSSCEINKFTI